MGFSFYSVIEAALLCVNAVAILNEQRLLSRFGGSGNQYTTGYADEFHQTGGAKQQLLTLIRSVRTVMRVPLVVFNIVTILFLVLFG
ncbi:unnamed protein product [Adineta ricciae]|uniref:Immediate early response 3-interacting protein 1 n=1 Tax=Adineta ricciae TaxID=249248 RepID=A0A815GPX3_ADIRI|nr:unnamed protein product [Adineta ricciae]